MTPFRTEIEVDPAGLSIAYTDKITLLGSCFVEHISSRFSAAGFQTHLNPFGILYNPYSLSDGIQDLLNERTFGLEDLLEEKGVYYSFSHHSRYSGTDAEALLQTINREVQSARRFLHDSSLLIVTFGTASVFRLKSSGRTVSNCHKLPASLFTHDRLSVPEIVSEWKTLIEKLSAFNPSLKILFTVSPIRHWKDGAHESQLNKATLLLAIDALRKHFAHCFYFPSYEILLDDLRDYRFYAEDMVHPSNQAVTYIWEKFSAAYFNPETTSLIREWERIQRDLNHRPFHPGSEAYQQFRADAETRAAAFRQRLEI